MSVSGSEAGRAGDIEREVARLRRRLSQLRAATLRINESPEFEAVLEAAMESARAITGARYAVIVLVDQHYAPVDFLASGMTAEQTREFWDTPVRWELFEPFFSAEHPLRLDDFHSYLRDQGLPEFHPPFEASEPLSYLSAPIFWREQRIGSIFLCEKVGGFSQQDEETLAMFAAQAALVISNASHYRQAQRAQAHLEALVSTAPVCVMVLDAATAEITSLNHASKRFLEEMGMTVESLQEAMLAASFRRPNGQVIAPGGQTLYEVLTSGETVRDEEIIIEFAHGQSFAAIVNATPIRSSDDEVDSVVVTAQDMSPLAELERLRAEFLGMIGHELRAPLAAIKGSATTLRQSESKLDPAEMAQFFRVIDEQADHMRELLSDLIDLVRIETGTLAVNASPTELARLIDEARTLYLGSGGRHNLSIDLPQDLPAVNVDRRRIVQVVTNLLINASRHSHEASPISIEAAADDGFVKVSVVDTGRGLRPERLPHLFEKYTRGEGSRHGHDLGLGLAICKGIVEAHGGRIWAHSDGPGLGSRFTFTVPAAQHVPTRAALPKVGVASGRPAASEPVRVLAVDDDPSMLKLIRDSLSEAGFEPTVTGDPDEVLNLVEELDPHVVLLDVVLPRADGIDLMRDIHAVADTPVIFLSAYSRDELIARALEMGASDYITKPFSPTELAARLSAALRKRPPQAPRRPDPRHANGSFELAELSIDYAERTVTVAGRPVELTQTEFDLLAVLSANAGVAMTHDQLLRQVWGPHSNGNVQRTRGVIKNLRIKLGDSARTPRFIVTVPRIGYRMPKTTTPRPDQPTR